MKKLYLTLILLLAGSISFSQMPGDTESLTPSDVNLFVKTREITRMLKTVKYMVYNLMDEQQRGEFIAERNKFRDKTGIDYLEEKSLKGAGIDTGRSVSFANFEKDNLNEVMLIFLPVIDEKEFPLKFIELLKKANADNPEMKITNITAVYKDVTVYQLKDDLYIAPANGYLLIGSTGDIIRRVIDVRESRGGNLMLDGNYKDYIEKGKNSYDINAFMTKKFLLQMNAPGGGNDDYGLFSLKNIIQAQSENTGEEKNKGAIFDSVDYIAAGLGLDGNKFQLNASAKLAKNNSYVDMLLGFIKTGVHDKSIYISTADSTMFMSMNLAYLNNLCKGDIEWCSHYNLYKQQLKTDFKIDLEKDFIPFHTGGINFIALDSAAAGGVGDLMVFVPMTDPKKTEELWIKIMKGMQAKYSKSKKFGEEKIGNRRGFWYIDESQMRFFVSYDQRGIYAGNSAGLIKAGLTGNTVDKSPNSGRYGKVINEKTFFLLNIRKNAFLKMMMQMRAQGNPDVAKSINRIGEIFLFCEKNDGFISVDFDVEIKESGKKK